MKNPGLIRIRLLGELQLVRRDGRASTLPASRKTRALLGYLVATGQAHRRERLCDLLWDGPGDPRAELRWSLSKIRPLLDGGANAHLAADRERVGVQLGAVEVDLHRARELLGKDLAGATTAALKAAADLFSGEFLDGLDLPLCYRFQEWCMAEREAVSRLRLATLSTLVERLEQQPADALAYARALVTVDPVSESGHAAVVRLLGRIGRNRDALDHYQHARRILETELGVAPSAELEEARHALRSAASPTLAHKPDVGSGDKAPAISRAPSSTSPMIGRTDERTQIQHIVDARPSPCSVVLVTGEPGIGKSRMLAHLGETLTAAGGRSFSARAYEAEATRPYGVWIDVLRSMMPDRTHDGVPPDLSLLLPEIGAPPADPGSRSRLFDAVVDMLRRIASEGPAGVIFDDIQWIDEASSSLLHFVARHVDAGSGLIIACAARTGEIDDNAAASRTLRSLAQDRRLHAIELSALSTAETAALVHQVDPTLDARRIFSESEGNPLFTLALAQAHRRGDSGPRRTVETIIAGQLAALTDAGRETLVWAAAYGRAFTLDDLALASQQRSAEMLSVLGELERRGLMRPLALDTYDFTHDLVRQTAYRTLSQPRRKLLHRHIARALQANRAADGVAAADLAHHAALAEDYGTAAAACIRAGEQALRLFANAEAESFAERGLRHVERLPDTRATLEARISLLKIRVLAASGPGMRPLPPLVETIAAATRAAARLGLQAAAATGYYLLSVLHQEAGDTRRAEKSTLRAADAGRTADDPTRARQLANTARCLLELETEVGRSRHLVAEADAIADRLGLDLCELHWARGLLERWDGHEAVAMSCIGRALALARQDEDRWREFKCLTWLAILTQELGRYDDMDALCAELKIVAERLGDDETPFAETLRALAALATGTGFADEVMADALARLRAVDDKSYLAYALNGAARLYRRGGRIEDARRCAAEALTVASTIGRRNEIAIAEAILDPLGAAVATHEDVGGEKASSERDRLSARARSAQREGKTPAFEIPTADPTLDRQGRRDGAKRR